MGGRGAGGRGGGGGRPTQFGVRRSGTVGPFGTIIGPNIRVDRSRLGGRNEPTGGDFGDEFHFSIGGQPFVTGGEGSSFDEALREARFVAEDRGASTIIVLPN